MQAIQRLNWLLLLLIVKLHENSSTTLATDSSNNIVTRCHLSWNTTVCGYQQKSVWQTQVLTSSAWWSVAAPRVPWESSAAGCQWSACGGLCQSQSTFCTAGSRRSSADGLRPLPTQPSWCCAGMTAYTPTQQRCPFTLSGAIFCLD